MIVGIVGLGLIGGSMAKSIKNRTAHTVYGADLNAETMTMARMCGAMDAPLTAENLPQCDLVLVAIRPGAAVEWVRQNAEHISKSAILVDLCGVKRTVVKAITPIAAEHGFAAFTTTLLASVYQDHDKIAQAAERYARQYGVTFLYRDFRPNFRAGNQRARELGFYMQKYCGCVFSEADRYQKQILRDQARFAE